MDKSTIYKKLGDRRIIIALVALCLIVVAAGTYLYLNRVTMNETVTLEAGEQIGRAHV
mgnify:CR=1 FL=1